MLGRLPAVEVGIALTSVRRVAPAATTLRVLGVPRSRHNLGAPRHRRPLLDVRHLVITCLGAVAGRKVGALESTLTALSWPGCAAQTVLLRVEGGGHTWPDGRQYFPAADIGPVTRDFGSERLWDFFARNRR